MMDDEETGDLTDFGANVSRETFYRLKRFEDLLIKWNPYASLVSRKSVSDRRDRHFRDSAQLYRFWPPSCGNWLDLGSGGGFPALVLACQGLDSHPETGFTLVEPNAKKCAFLNTVARELGLNARIETVRAESLEPQNADVVSARALAPLEDLLGYAERHLAPDGLCIFPKGEGYEREIDAALQNWKFDLDIVRSETKNGAAILLARNIRRV